MIPALLPLIVVLNSSRVPDTTIQRWVAEIQRQVHEDFAPVWHMDADVRFARSQPPPNAWQVRIVPGTRWLPWGGYHLMVGDHGAPYADVYDIPGEHTDLILSHEILEMLANPFDNRYVKDYPWVWSLEPVDPVQRRSYTRNGTMLSDFVFPAWFDSEVPPGTRLDHLGACHAPGQVLPGGVAIRINFTNGIYERHEHD